MLGLAELTLSASKLPLFRAGLAKLGFKLFVHHDNNAPKHSVGVIVRQDMPVARPTHRARDGDGKGMLLELSLLQEDGAPFSLEVLVAYPPSGVHGTRLPRALFASRARGSQGQAGTWSMAREAEPCSAPESVARERAAPRTS